VLAIDKISMRMNYNDIIYIITVILLILVIVKTWLFFSGVSNKRFANWLYFSHYTLYNSRNEKSRKFKVLQNKFTWFILSIALIDIILTLLFQYI
jgi:hypothetical protein